MKFWAIFIVIVFSFKALSLVDTKNANYTKTFVHIAVPGTDLPFLVELTYNSRSLYKGMFGYGWCSNLETRLEVLPDNTLLVVECGGGAEVSYVTKQDKGHNPSTIKKIMSVVRNKKGLSHKYIKQVERDLSKSALLRSELIRAFGLKGKAKTGVTYKALGRQNNSIQFTGNEYKRYLPSGRIQAFNSKGLLVKETDRFGNWIKIKRKKQKQELKD